MTAGSVLALIKALGVGSGGGGGSSGGGDVFVLHIDYDESEDKYTIRETLADIGTAATAGKTFIAVDDLNFCVLYASIAMIPNVGVVAILISDNIRVDAGRLIWETYEVNVETMEVTVESDAYVLTPATD